jgi:hypothetical protein
MRAQRSRATALLLSAAVALTTSGCVAAPVALFADVPAPATETPVETPWRHRVAEPVVEPAPIEGEPVEVFGRAAVEAAYDETVEFAANTTFDEMLLVPTPYRGKAQFLRHVSRMTATMSGEWNALVTDAWNGDQDALEGVFACRFFFNHEPGYRIQETGPLVLEHVIEDPEIAVARDEGIEAPQVSFVQRGDVRMRVDGEDVLVRHIKTATYWLAPAPPGDAYRWRIDGYDITWETADPVPDTGTY